MASLCAQTGQVQNVRDAQRCPYFNPDVDTMTGYTTHSLLCAPVIVRGKYVSYMQLEISFSLCI